MFGTNRNGVNAYANVGIETGVAAASPHKLIVMLYDGACVAIRSALMHMQNGDIPAKGTAISKAMSIIENGLRASLDVKAGGEIAANLDALYEYMGKRLLQANLENDAAKLDEVLRLLSDLRTSWNAIGEPKPSQPEAPAQPIRSFQVA
jgi:flagellar protein FliS